MSAEEAAVLSRYLAREITSKTAAEELRSIATSLAQSGASLSNLSQRFLSLPDPNDGGGEVSDLQYPSSHPGEILGMRDYSNLAGGALTTGEATGSSAATGSQRGSASGEGASSMTPLNLDRARLLDGMTPDILSSLPDSFTCMAPLHMVGRTQDSTCLVLCTAGGKLLVLGPDVSTTILTVSLPQPATQIFLEGQVSEEQGVMGGTWRATVLGREGLIMSLRGGNLSKNQISLESLPHFVARIGNSVYCITNVPRPCSVVRLTPRGRMDYSHSLPSPFACGCVLDMVHGKPFKGFVFGLHDSSLVFFNPNGLTTVAPLKYPTQGEDNEADDQVEPRGDGDGRAGGLESGAEGGTRKSPKASSGVSAIKGSLDSAAPPYFRYIYFGRLGESDDALVCVRSDGSVVVCTLTPGYDLNRPQDHTTPLEQGPFDVEDQATFGGPAGSGPDLFPVDALEIQQEQFRAFLASRAFAKAMVLGELVEAERRPEKRSTPAHPSGLSYSADITLATNLATLILTATNPTSIPSMPTVVSVSSDILRPDDAAVPIPVLPPGGSTIRHFVLRPKKLTGEARIVRAHSVYVLAARAGASDDCRPETVLEAAVPEFLVA